MSKADSTLLMDLLITCFSSDDIGALFTKTLILVMDAHFLGGV